MGLPGDHLPERGTDTSSLVEFEFAARLTVRDAGFLRGRLVPRTRLTLGCAASDARRLRNGAGRWALSMETSALRVLIHHATPSVSSEAFRVDEVR